MVNKLYFSNPITLDSSLRSIENKWVPQLVRKKGVLKLMGTNLERIDANSNKKYFIEKQHEHNAHE